MPYTMGPAKQPDSGTNNPPMTNALANTASAIYAGSLLGLTSNLLVALATTPTAGTIVGVAASDNNTAPGLNMGNQPPVINFGGNIIPYYRATTDTIYASHVVSGSDTYVQPTQSNVGVSYGLRVRADGEVCIDLSLTTTNARATLLRIQAPTTTPATVEWTFLATAILP